MLKMRVAVATVAVPAIVAAAVSWTACRRESALAFAIAHRFRSRLHAAGFRVTWVPFDGGHEIPALAVRRLNEFIAELPRTQ